MAYSIIRSELEESRSGTLRTGIELGRALNETDDKPDVGCLTTVVVLAGFSPVTNCCEESEFEDTDATVNPVLSERLTKEGLADCTLGDVVDEDA